MRCAWLAGLLAPFAAACTNPPQTAYVQSGTGLEAGLPKPLGHDAEGDACAERGEDATHFEIVCVGAGGEGIRAGRLTREAAHHDLAYYASQSAWRRTLDTAVRCEAPLPSKLLGADALTLKCAWRDGAFPLIACVVILNGEAWLTDVAPTSVPLLERAIALAAGRGDTAAAQSVQNAAPGSGRQPDLVPAVSGTEPSEQLRRRATDANLAGDYAEAKRLYEELLARLDETRPDRSIDYARTLALIALQDSNLGDYAAADQKLARAQAQASGLMADDPLLGAQICYYRALNELNQGRAAAALALLQQALPAYQHYARPPRGDAAALRAPADAISKRAAYGLADIWRARAASYRMLGQAEQGARAAGVAEAVRAQYGLTNTKESARILRSQAIAGQGGSRAGVPLRELQRAAAAGAQALPGTGFYVETTLLLAARAVERGDIVAAQSACAAAQGMLLHVPNAGQSADLLRPCLTLLAPAATGGDQAAAKLMFALAQHAHSGTADGLIALASARLLENARDPRLGALMRRRQDSALRLAGAFEALQQAGGDAARIAILRKQVADLEQDGAQLDEALQSAAPNYGSLTGVAVSAEEVLGALHADEALAFIVLASNTGWTFLLRNNTVAVAPIDGGADGIDPLVARIRHGVDDRAADGTLPAFDMEAAHELYARIFGAMAPRLQGVSALAVVPAGTLLRLPFGLLLAGPAAPGSLASAPWLINRLVISHLPAPANFVQLRRVVGTSRADRPWIGFGDAIPVSLPQAEASFPAASCAGSAVRLAGLTKLTGARAELDGARDIMHGGARDEFLGADFTAGAVSAEPLERYRILHFAAHALLQSDLACQPEPALVASAVPGTADASGALLAYSRILNLHLDADAVVLSACSTAGESAEGLGGLARGFFWAGARSVLATHWAADDKVLAALVDATLLNYRNDPADGIAAALARAQRTLLAATGSDVPSGYAHPFYWAPLALMGDGSGADLRSGSIGP